jgi:hypothetical protein
MHNHSPINHGMHLLPYRPPFLSDGFFFMRAAGESSLGELLCTRLIGSYCYGCARILGRVTLYRRQGIGVVFVQDCV